MRTASKPPPRASAQSSSDSVMARWNSSSRGLLRTEEVEVDVAGAQRVEHGLGPVEVAPVDDDAAPGRGVDVARPAAMTTKPVGVVGGVARQHQSDVG